jgi:CubicO group peptidase (beta-lactamase class C family)
MGQESSMSTIGDDVRSTSITTQQDAKPDEECGRSLTASQVTMDINNETEQTENIAPKEQEDGEPSSSQTTVKNKCCRCCRTADGQTWSWKKILFGIVLFVVVVIVTLCIYSRVAYKGYFTPKCAKPKTEIASLDSLDSCIAEITEEYGVVGLAVAIVTTKAKGIAWSQTYGYANLEREQKVKDSTPFLLSSVSKLFIAVAVMQQVESGVLDLDEDINIYLPFEVINPLVSSSSNNRITLRDLSTHTSGLVDTDYAFDMSYGPGDPTESLGEFLKAYFDPNGVYYSESDNFVSCLSGECLYEYSNYGSSLAAFVVESAVGIPFAQYVEENILMPLGMSDSHYYLANYTDPNIIAMPYSEDLEPYGYYGYPDYPDGRLFTSTQDLSKFLASIMIDEDDGSGPPSILSVNRKKEMLTPQPIQEKLSWTDKLYYGSTKQEIFWIQTNGITHGHDGGDDGSLTFMYYEPNSGVGIIILTNSEDENGAIALMNIVKQVTEQSSRISELLSKDEVQQSLQ